MLPSYKLIVYSLVPIDPRLDTWISERGLTFAGDAYNELIPVHFEWRAVCSARCAARGGQAAAPNSIARWLVSRPPSPPAPLAHM
ncbi:unnamed protein product [Colias eurytheme]|nr:unnamed protein product [Colias eurytheme]